MFQLLSIVLVLLALAGPGTAQQPVNPGQQPGAGPTPAAPDAAQRNPNFEYMLAFGGIGLVLLVICYPSRRY